MVKCVFLCSVFLLVFAVFLFGADLPQVLQPNTTVYSASEIAALMQATAALQKALNDYSLGSRKTFAADEWQSRDFAAYTAGILAGKGYKTVLVSSDGWPDGVHTWVIVGIPLNGKTAWVPVEASPKAGHTQLILGVIPVSTDTTGKMHFDSRYLSFSKLISLPPNRPPVAEIRPPVSAIIAGEQTRLLALGSYDPDGEIVLYLWDFGDGTKGVDTVWVARHTFNKPGSYTVTLTVIDNRGSRSVTDPMLRVLSAKEAASPSSGCGCHH